MKQETFAELLSSVQEGAATPCREAPQPPSRSFEISATGL